MHLSDQEELRLEIIDWGAEGSPSNWDRANRDWKVLVDMYWKEKLNA